LDRTTENINNYLGSTNNKDYLQDLLLNIKEAYVNQKSITFKIVEAKDKGFVVKVGGLFAYISFHHFCWSYPTIEYWKNISNWLIGSYFKGKIHEIKESPIKIYINAKDQVYEKPNFEKFKEYRGIIVHKARYGLFVDLGIHFNWKFGSLLGLLHKANLINQTDYDNWSVGEQITTSFLGYHKKESFTLGDKYKIWLIKEMEELIDSIQKVNVVIDENERFKFYVLNKYKATIPILKEFYPNYRDEVRKFVYELRNGDIIACKVIRINLRKESLVLKLLIQKPTE